MEIHQAGGVGLRETFVRLLKYITAAYVDALIDGAVGFQPLSSFQACEVNEFIGD